MERISTAQLAQTGIEAINKNQSKMNELIQQIGSGIRTDLDPVEKAQQLAYTVKISDQAQNIRNGETVLPSLVAQESALRSISEKLIQLQETMTSSQNPATYDSVSLKKVVSNLREDILSLANTKDSEGNYLFGGYRSQIVPFIDLDKYQGDQGIRRIRIEGNTLVQVNVTGEDIITVNVRDAFRKMDNFLSSGITDPTMIDSVQSAISDISVQSTIMGSNINKINEFKNINENMNINDQSRLGEIEGADLGNLISQLAATKAASEASLKSYSMIQGLSLFDYI